MVFAEGSSAPVARLWQVATDWSGHGRFFPLTTVQVDSSATGVGQRLHATTRLGPLHLDDPMVVTRWSPPGERGCVELTKLGRVLGGRARLDVEPVGSGSRLRWTTDVGPAPARLRRATAPLSRLAAIPLYRHVVRAIAREAEHG
ncbi:SRPBCC family protein [Flexivirga sp. B27]